MAKRGKKYREAVGKIDREHDYELVEACKLVKETSYSKMDASVDLAVNLGVDPRHADQNIRGATPLPHGLGKKVRIVVFAKGEKAAEASELNVDFVGADDLAKKITDGWLDFDHVIATPDMMGVVGRLGKLLGPRGLMPNPKLGTVTFDVAKAVSELRAGRAEYRVDKAGIVHTSIGRVGFTEQQLSENIKTVLDALLKAKPSTAKGTYMKKVSLSATMGPGVRIDPAPFRN
ncbi:50S ribosomal protein L1 [Pseudobacteriovorax antillogorgiicola]|uniref:Large ribosomal subunit protein uL1 n=1 Tax=Pseudobacteriovorax antillogorgiicola TaxID=1513793 RepID=A0A1Y6B3B6_9BACT|nr:50S ribosomal protein L1 [Pseudobacteriovorax antillogorgiicola]TCS59488.1 LSU ribosomal protein L1P [Pseudobacteriovorax antillogorgiicola]SME87966.1 LSU ribosomal protein L1P [Pseudobacteriovorax antillogorgiicola]